MKRTLDVNYHCSIQWKGTHQGVHYMISEHAFRDEPSPFLLPSIWCTYVLLSEEQHAEVKPRIDDAPWNGGQTYYRKMIDEPMDCIDSDLKARLSKPYYKIGDDFSHIWDDEHYAGYSLPYMEWHIKKVIDFLIGKSE